MRTWGFFTNLSYKANETLNIEWLAKVTKKNTAWKALIFVFYILKVNLDLWNITRKLNYETDQRTKLECMSSYVFHNALLGACIIYHIFRFFCFLITKKLHLKTRQSSGTVLVFLGWDRDCWAATPSVWEERSMSAWPLHEQLLSVRCRIPVYERGMSSVKTGSTPR